MQKIVENDEKHTLVSEEDQPLAAQSLRGGDYVGRCEWDGEDGDQKLVRYEPGGGWGSYRKLKIILSQRELRQDLLYPID